MNPGARVVVGRTQDDERDHIDAPLDMLDHDRAEDPCQFVNRNVHRAHFMSGMSRVL